MYLARRVPNDASVDYVDVQLRPRLFFPRWANCSTPRTSLRDWRIAVPLPPGCGVSGGIVCSVPVPRREMSSTAKRNGQGTATSSTAKLCPSRGLTARGPSRRWLLSAPMRWSSFVQMLSAWNHRPGPRAFGLPELHHSDHLHHQGHHKPQERGAGTPWRLLQAPDGRMNVLTTTGSIAEISQGFERYIAEVPTAAIHDIGQRCVRWYMASMKQMKLDYVRPPLDQPAGTWIEDSNVNLTAAVGAFAIGGSAVMVDAGTASEVRTWQAGVTFADNGTSVLTDMQLGKMAPAGFLGEIDLDEFQLSSTRLGGNSAYSYTLTDNQGNTEVHTDAASTTADVWFRSAISRTREFRLRIQEVTSTGEGRSFDGISCIIRPRGRLHNPYRRIA